jgi:transcriptional regulator with XRE-family HTH domain
VSPIILRIRELREARGWTQTELADRVGVRQATISAIENAHTTGIDFNVLERLADAFGVEPGALFTRVAQS